MHETASMVLTLFPSLRATMVGGQKGEEKRGKEVKEEGKEREGRLPT